MVRDEGGGGRGGLLAEGGGPAACCAGDLGRCLGARRLGVCVVGCAAVDVCGEVLAGIALVEAYGIIEPWNWSMRSIMQGKGRRIAGFLKCFMPERRVAEVCHGAFALERSGEDAGLRIDVIRVTDKRVLPVSEEVLRNGVSVSTKQPWLVLR